MQFPEQVRITPCTRPSFTAVVHFHTMRCLFCLRNHHKPMIRDEVIVSKIYEIREQRIMLDRDLADLYGVATKVLKQAVRRNIKRFPQDFMFEMTKEELDNWRSQIVTSNSDRIVSLTRRETIQTQRFQSPQQYPKRKNFLTKFAQSQSGRPQKPALSYF